MFGQHPCLPIDVEYGAANSLEDPDLVEPTEEDIEHALENLLSARMETKELASKNIKCAQQKQKEYYDQNDGFLPIQGEDMYKYSTLRKNSILLCFIRYPDSSYWW